MSTFGLKKIRDAMQTVWGYGDILFAKDVKEINFNKHNNIYPMCIVVTPDSTTPNIYEGWENYDYEVYFSMLWKKVNRQTSDAEEKYDNIQLIGNEWLDRLLNLYDNEDLILDPNTLEIERIKNFGNDKLLTIKFTFTLQGFRTCFNPKKFYPQKLTGASKGTPMFNPNTDLTYRDNDNVTMYKLINGSSPPKGFGGYKCTGWYRASGWKKMELKKTTRYIMTLEDMSANPFHAMHSAKGVTSETDNWATLRSDSEDTTPDTGQGNSKAYAHTLNGIEPTVDNGLKGKGYKIGSIVTNVQQELGYTQFNGVGFSIGLVFQLNSAAGDDGTVLFSTGSQGQIQSSTNGYIASFGIKIYFDDGEIVFQTINDTNPSTVTETKLDCTTIFGADCYTREDKTVAITFSYDGSAVLQYRTPWMITDTSAIHMTTQTLNPACPIPTYGAGEIFLLVPNGGQTIDVWQDAFRNNFYECVLYNYPLGIFFSAVAEGKSNLEYLTDYFNREYGLN